MENTLQGVPITIESVKRINEHIVLFYYTGGVIDKEVIAGHVLMELIALTELCDGKPTLNEVFQSLTHHYKAHISLVGHSQEILASHPQLKA